MSMSDIKVSVITLAFNHEPYIRQCLDGLLMQKTDFAFEVLIHDDASTDNTALIIREYQDQFPNIIKPVFQTENQYSKGIPIGATFLYPKAQGKYIAECEGDDYWTDPLKLQKQVDFLESHSDFSICFHPVKVLIQEKGELVDDFITRDVPDESDIYELAKGNYIHTPSVLYRNDPRITEWLSTIGPVFIGDYVLHMLNAKLGRIKRLPETMAVYRYGTGVLSSDKSIRSGLEYIIALSKLSVFMEDPVLVSIIEHSLQQQKTALCEAVNKQYLSYKRILFSKSYRMGKYIMKPLSIFKRLIISNKSL